MRIGLTSWNVGFFEYLKSERKWIVPQNDNRNADKIAQKVLSHSSDIIVLNEFGKTSSRHDLPIDGERIITTLEKKGYVWIMSNNYYRSVLIAIKKELGLNFDDNSDEIKGDYMSFLSANINLPNKCCKVKKLNVLGVGVPALDEKGEKREIIEEFWNNRILNYAEKYSRDENAATIITGDFNAYLPDDVASENRFENGSEFSPNLIRLNKILFDSWRIKHTNLYGRKNVIKDDAWTWYSLNGIGRRLDYAFVSKNLIDSINAEHFHSERIEGYSDHSAVHITFEV